MADVDTDPDLQAALAGQHAWTDLVQRTPAAAPGLPAAKASKKPRSDPQVDARLLAAVVTSDAAAVRAALADGANPNACQKAGRESALILAVTNQADALVTLLLDAGANPDAATVKGVTALHRCLDHDRRDLAEQLIAAGADPDPYTMASERLFDLALGRLKQNPCPTMLAWLLDRGDRPAANAKNTSTWSHDVLRIVLNTGHAGLLAALNRAHGLPDRAPAAQALMTLGLTLVEKAWELAIERDSADGLRLLVEHGWTPGLRQVGNARAVARPVGAPPFAGVFWGWSALAAGASRCTQWCLQLPQAAPMMVEDATQYPGFTVGRVQRPTAEHLTLLLGMGIPLDLPDANGERLFRRLAKWSSLPKTLVAWSLQHAPRLMTLPDKDGVTPLDQLRQTDGALASWCESRVLKKEMAQAQAEGTVPEPGQRRTRSRL